MEACCQQRDRDGDIAGTCACFDGFLAVDSDMFNWHCTSGHTSLTDGRMLCSACTISSTSAFLAGKTRPSVPRFWCGLCALILPGGHTVHTKSVSHEHPLSHEHPFSSARVRGNAALAQSACTCVWAALAVIRPNNGIADAAACMQSTMQQYDKEGDLRLTKDEFVAFAKQLCKEGPGAHNALPCEHTCSDFNDDYPCSDAVGSARHVQCYLPGRRHEGDVMHALHACCLPCL